MSPLISRFNASMKFCAALLLSSLLAVDLFAAELPATTQFKCRNAADQKIVSLDYPGRKHLCEVSTTSIEGAREVKWYADQDSEFCNIKLKELVGKFQTLWGYRCEGLKQSSSILELTLRHRKAVEALIKDAKREGQDAGIPFTVTDARAHAAELTDRSRVALVVQLLMDAQDINITKPIDRTYFIEDDGQRFQTRSVWSGLHNSVTLEDQKYRVDSALINGINPDGEIIVATVLSSTSELSENTISCTGNQLLKTTESGDLFPASEHLINCD